MVKPRNTSVTSGKKVSTLPIPDLAYEEIRHALLEWFQHHQRDLPWRQTKDPYAIWLSEIMLQQTRVTTVIPYYKRFLERFPTVESLAEAALDDVLALWSGLGYYRRARHLHAAAQDIVERFEGQLPADHKALLSIKGIGRYTAGAIASIAFDLPFPAVDGNVFRIFARLCCLKYPINSTALHKIVEAMANVLAKGERPGELTQGLMELGALICTPKSPTCLLCPIREHCSSLETGQVDLYPVPKRKTKVQDITVQWALLRRSGRVLFIQRPEDGLFAGLWELPGLYLSHPGPDEPTLLLEQLEEWGLQLQLSETVTPYQHTLSHRQLHIQLYHGTQLRGRLNLPRHSFRWISLKTLDELPISSITRRVLKAL